MDVVAARIEAAAGLVTEVGDGFTMDDLAARAQVPRATLYRRVGNKQALLARLADTLHLAHAVAPPSRTRILLATRRVLARAGLAGATMEQIASEADVGVTTVYRQFGDKVGLIRAAIAELSARPFVRDLAAPTDDVSTDLHTIAATLLPFFWEYRDLLRLILTVDPRERAAIEQLRAGSDRTLDQLAAYFAAQIAAGRLAAAADPSALALAFLGLLLTYTVIGPTHYAMPLDDVDGTAALIARLFVAGVRT